MIAKIEWRHFINERPTRYIYYCKEFSFMPISNSVMTMQDGQELLFQNPAYSVDGAKTIITLESIALSSVTQYLNHGWRKDREDE